MSVDRTLGVSPFSPLSRVIPNFSNVNVIHRTYYIVCKTRTDVGTPGMDIIKEKKNHNKKTLLYAHDRRRIPIVRMRAKNSIIR